MAPPGAVRMPSVFMYSLIAAAAFCASAALGSLPAGQHTQQAAQEPQFLPSRSLLASKELRTETRGLVVPLDTRHGHVRRRGLLRSGVLPVMGAVRELGYFYARISVGRPARNFSMIIDTGSTITYVPCYNCEHCGKHEDEAFDPQQSTTSLQLGCSHPQCVCGSPDCQCKQDKCYYTRSYAEHSTSEGWLLQDNFNFPDGQAPARVVFGCENKETGEIFRQTADGILGMGNNKNAFQSQLVEQNIMEDIFGLCFGYPAGGVMLLGDVSLPSNVHLVYTPLVTSLYSRNYLGHYFNVEVLSLTVGEVQLPVRKEVFAKGYGAVLDSGTTFTHLPAEAFSAFSAAVNHEAKAKGLSRVSGSDPQYEDICWSGAPTDVKELQAVFPTAYFQFGGNSTLTMSPIQYLFVASPGTYCLGVFENEKPGGTLIGGISVRDVLVVYDRRKGRIGFAPTPCNRLQQAVSQAGHASHGGSSSTDDHISAGRYKSEQAADAAGPTEALAAHGGMTGKAAAAAAGARKDADVNRYGRDGSGGNNQEDGKVAASEGQKAKHPGGGSRKALSPPRLAALVLPAQQSVPPKLTGSTQTWQPSAPSVVLTQRAVPRLDHSSPADVTEKAMDLEPMLVQTWSAVPGFTGSEQTVYVILLALTVVPVALLLDGYFHEGGPTQRWAAVAQTFIQKHLQRSSMQGV